MSSHNSQYNVNIWEDIDTPSSTTRPTTSQPHRRHSSPPTPATWLGALAVKTEIEEKRVEEYLKIGEQHWMPSLRPTEPPAATKLRGPVASVEKSMSGAEAPASKTKTNDMTIANGGVERKEK